MAMLVEYVRDKRRNAIGAVVAVGAGKVGWSLCMKADRKFGVADKQFAVDAAVSRAEGDDGISVPRSISDKFEKMVNRSKRYFK